MKPSDLKPNLTNLKPDLINVKNNQGQIKDLQEDIVNLTPEIKEVNKNGHIEFVHGSKMFLSNSQMFVKPQVGKFYVFPHYLMHLVYPFKGQGERRSISFNGEIDQTVFLETYGAVKVEWN